MSTATITIAQPVMGPAYDHSKPETRQPWLDFRQGGITATQIRDWGIGSRRRQILIEKATGETEDLSGNKYVNHGNLREPVIAEWVHTQYGIEPCDNVFAHPDNPRHLASPDGVSRDIFSGGLIVANESAVLCEIKTSSSDLTPGELDAASVLMEVEEGSPFDRKGYYTQMQWQMYVMNATMTLFVYEQHNGELDPDTDTFTPVGPPMVAWIPRDQRLIDRLVHDVAPKALAEIDAARLSNSAGGMPPTSDLTAEQALLVADLLSARTAEAVAKAKKEKAFAELKAQFAGEGKPDMKIDAGDAWITVSTSEKERMVFDEEGATKRAPKMVAQYKALVKRYTKPVVQETQSFTVTAKKESK